jgi:5-methylcytosine-specific restriction endonuclease McrA
MKQTVVLNADYTYLNTVNWKRAIRLLVQEKAETLKEADRTVYNADRTCSIRVPLVLRLVNMVKTVYRNKIPWSKKNMFIRDNFKCQYCGSTENLTMDHVIPKSRGGKTNFLNCVTSCHYCNAVKKKNRTPEEAGMKLRKAPYNPTIMDFLIYKMKHTGGL